MTEYHKMCVSTTSTYACACCYRQFHAVFNCEKCGKDVCKKCMMGTVPSDHQICHWCAGKIPTNCR